MTQPNAASAKKTAQNASKSRKESVEHAALARRYGQIGIPAVAAAVRYQGTAKNPAYAPSPMTWDAMTWDERAGEAA
jgi:hypothetical protein